MAAAFLPGNLQDEATCSVCLEFFRDPVSIECGHNFCRACIAQSWRDLEADFPCPQCREVFPLRSFRPNRPLANMSEIIAQLARRGAREAEAGGQCPRHREALKLYCKDDASPICVVCDRSREHRPHAVVPVDEASEEYKVALRPSGPPSEQILLGQLEKMEKNISRRQNENISELSKEITLLNKLITELEEKIQQPVLEFLKDVTGVISR
ncbi:E3 ubiquitin-protein ligase TRIM41-like [Empidonax traillii]|uniref:E3 ubiquitin-protein ligase TRIM41-like n=1 Tax=Empidonax traillii TaxID=164674 RepID=UPI000FFD15DB|nr:E3 ubiquitin-protein ligase TRIM41-like [Empidonax traillii]